MSYSIQQIQDEILSDLRGFLDQDVYEQTIPDNETVPRRGGLIVPVVTIQFGTPTPQGGKSFVGPWGDDHIMVVYVQAIAPKIQEARFIANRIDTFFLGRTYPWSGNVRKRAEGYPLSVATSTGSTEAYQMPTAYTVPVQMSMEA